MRITDIVINEASAAEKARQRKIIAQQQRLTNLQSEKQKQLLSQQAAVKRLEKRITKFDPATSVSSAEQPTELVGKSAANDIDPRYIYNPEYDELESTKDINGVPTLRFTGNEQKYIKEILDLLTKIQNENDIKRYEEIITYAFSSPVFADFLNNVESDLTVEEFNEHAKPKTFWGRLKEILLNIMIFK